MFVSMGRGHQAVNVGIVYETDVCLSKETVYMCVDRPSRVPCSWASL